jgi:hypothetical protein
MRKKPNKPHTKEWFKDMESRNPMQAQMARLAIKNSGTEMCCSICGDTDVHDYMADEEISARLCDDCKKMQENMYKAVFLPLT